jgi:hypothetical protein
MSSASKDTIYIDIDDEITTIIDKVLGSKHSIIALVLPKRAAVLQSIVNMKLLKRTADENGKKVVLITSESGLLPLAGAVGIYVAKTLQTRPVLPPAPGVVDSAISIDADDTATEVPEIDANRPIGELAGLPEDGEEETIEVDNDEEALDEQVPIAVGKKGLNKKLKIPNFEAFRVRLFLGISVFVLLLIGWYWAYFIAPKANVVIKTDTSDVTVNLELIARPGIDALDAEKNIVPATTKEYKKTDSQKTQASGQKDAGTKATGVVSLKNCTKTDGGITIPAGTGVSTSSFTFITQSDVTLPASTFTGGGTCTTSSKDVNVTAQNAGGNYNLNSGRTFSVSGYSSVTGSNSTAMSGGTTKIVKVVAQTDLDTIKQKVQDQNQQTATDELAKQLDADGFFALRDTITVSSATVTSTPAVNEEGTEITVNSTITYTMVGLKKDDLKQLIQKDAKQHIDPAKQSILDEGLGNAAVRVGTKEPNGDIRLNFQTVATAGPQLDAASIKKEIAGKKRGDAETLIKARPGIKEVKITYSPFWVYATPKNTAKITITFEKSENANSKP